MKQYNVYSMKVLTRSMKYKVHAMVDPTVERQEQGRSLRRALFVGKYNAGRYTEGVARFPKCPTLSRRMPPTHKQSADTRGISLLRIHRSTDLSRFSEEPAIVAELVHLKEPSTSMGPEPAMDYVRRAVWGMLYADDTCIVS